MSDSVMHDDDRVSRRFYMVAVACDGADVWTAVEAVSSTAIEHPEWDMDEMKTWAEWEAELGE